jgi:replication-associated recombination protein RarA
MTMFTPKTELEAILRSALDKRTEELDAASAEIARLREALQTYERTLRNAGDLKHNQLIEIADEIRTTLQEKP